MILEPGELTTTEKSQLHGASCIRRVEFDVVMSGSCRDVVRRSGTVVVDILFASL